MDFNTRADVEAPAAFVFDQLSDFAAFEKLALRRGAEVLRADRMPAAGPGALWRATFTYAGKPRRMLVTLDEFAPPRRMRFDLESRNLAGELAIDLHELSLGQTRMLMKLRLKPTTIAARMMLQGLRLAKGRTVRRMQERLGLLAREIEARYRPPAGS